MDHNRRTGLQDAMNPHLHRVLGLSIGFVLAGCGGPASTGFVTGKPRSAHDGVVRVHMAEAQQPSGGFEEVAILYTQVKKPDRNLALRELEAQARELGCTDLVKVEIANGVEYASAYGVCGVVAGASR